MDLEGFVLYLANKASYSASNFFWAYIASGRFMKMVNQSEVITFVVITSPITVNGFNIYVTSNNNAFKMHSAMPFRLKASMYVNLILMPMYMPNKIAAAAIRMIPTYVIASMLTSRGSNKIRKINKNINIKLKPELELFI